MRGSLKIGRIAKVPVSLHWSLVAIAFFLAWDLADVQLPDRSAGHSPSLYWALGLGAAVLFFAAVLAHELGHAVVARRRGIAVEGIELWALGGLARLGRDPQTPGAEFSIAVAGPIMSLVSAGAFYATEYALRYADIQPAVVATFSWLWKINVFLAIFNILPAAPLDGGRILRSAVWKITGDRWRAMKVSAKAGQGLGYILIGGGVWLLMNGYTSIMVPVIGWFLLNSARMEEVGARTEAALIGKRVRDATWFGVARATDATDVATMLWQSGRMGPPRLVAVERFDGSLAGLVSEDQLHRVPESERPWVRLAQLVVPMDQLARANPDDPLMDAARRMNPRAPVLTVWDEGRLVGVVNSEQFRRLIEKSQLASASRSTGR